MAASGTNSDVSLASDSSEETDKESYISIVEGLMANISKFKEQLAAKTKELAATKEELKVKTTQLDDLKQQTNWVIFLLNETIAIS